MRHLLIIENEDSVRKTLGFYSEQSGYKPILISDPSVCNALKSKGQQCSTKKPCADSLLIDNDLPAINGFRLLELQLEKGCKVASQQKAIMASTITEQAYKKASHLGCHLIQKPVTFEDLEHWLNGLEGAASC